ncbi:DnaD domain-containing protein [Bacillus solimangrovi]|uniref:DNA replication protein DnaD n=1 Tax=Bacillus solimangrovi TaxID=1305675 RepID=A0A1E5LH67_9BACI|nr:DnaD domain-containing protein [Bacillus solimangrovi]OEH93415.1 DNA replication protein DnaD [Bacillus solimangrovi]
MEQTQMINWLTKGNISIPVILLESYPQLGIDEKEVMLLLHIHSYLDRGNTFPTPDEMAIRMSIGSQGCMEILHALLRKGCLAIEEEKDLTGVMYERYTLRPLWEKLIRLIEKNEQEQEKQQAQADEGELFQMFEREFARVLSPMEYETIAIWVDQEQYSPVLIKAALKEAVISGKLNLRYIDRILFEWKKNGVKTVEQARERSLRFRQHQPSRKQPPQAGQASESKGKTVPFYNWLEQ